MQERNEKILLVSLLIATILTIAFSVMIEYVKEADIVMSLALDMMLLSAAIYLMALILSYSDKPDFLLAGSIFLWITIFLYPASMLIWVIKALSGFGTQFRLLLASVILMFSYMCIASAAVECLRKIKRKRGRVLYSAAYAEAERHIAEITESHPDKEEADILIAGLLRSTPANMRPGIRDEAYQEAISRHALKNGWDRGYYRRLIREEDGKE